MAEEVILVEAEEVEPIINTEYEKYEINKTMAVDLAKGLPSIIKERETLMREVEQKERGESDRSGWVGRMVAAKQKGDEGEAESLAQQAESQGHRGVRRSAMRRKLELEKPRLEQYWKRNRRMLQQRGMERPQPQE